MAKDNKKLQLVVVVGTVGLLDRKDMEDIENQVFTLSELEEALNPTKEKKDSYTVYPLTDFMDLLNNEELDYENSWISYVQISDSPYQVSSVKPLIITENIDNVVNVFESEAEFIEFIKSEHDANAEEVIKCPKTFAEALHYADEYCEGFRIIHRPSQKVENKEQKGVKLVQFIEEYQDLMLAMTNMTREQIKSAMYAEKYENSDMDYEEKLDAYAEENNLYFERVYADVVHA